MQESLDPDTTNGAGVFPHPLTLICFHTFELSIRYGLIMAIAG